MCLALSTGESSSSLVKNINERLFSRYNNPALPVFTVYKALFTLCVILQLEPGEARVQRTNHLDVRTSKHQKRLPSLLEHGPKTPVCNNYP